MSGKARPLFLAEGRHLDGVLQPLACARQLRDDGDAGQHAKGAVVASRIQDRIEVGAEQNGRGVRPLPFVTAKHAAKGIG